MNPEADLMRESKPQPAQSSDRIERLESFKAAAPAKSAIIITEMNILDDSWRESQVEEPERWDGMS
jgi:hypothetical protein